MKVLILSDIHGNISALNAVLNAAHKTDIDSCLILGDSIDYGMHSNEVLETLNTLPYPILVNLYGNHEQAIMDGEYTRFSSDRGKESAKNTRGHLSKGSFAYIESAMNVSGMEAIMLDGYSILTVHGNLQDPYWGTLAPDVDPEEYAQFDLVLSGHSHIPHYFERLVPADDPARRNKKVVRFLNPGSVGQPRNHDPQAHFAIIDTATGSTSLERVEYNIAVEQQAFDSAADEVDLFYKERLALGI